VFTTEQARAALDGTVYSTNGEKIGKVGQIYLDDQTNEPEWVTVATGLFGTRESFVPLSEAKLEGDRVVVPYDKDKIKDAPSIDADAGQISREEEGQLYRYYGKDYSDERSDSGLVEGDAAPKGSDRAGTSIETDSDLTSTDAERAGTSVDTDSDLSPDRTDALRRAEERLNEGMAPGQGRVRLRKYVVTEEQTITVPVLREEVRVEREPDVDNTADSESIDVRGERSTSSAQPESGQA
jgi:stress response protein YsnF